MVTVSFAESSIEHSGITQQATMSAMQGREWPASNVSVFGEEHTAGLTVCCRFWQQILHFVEWNASMRERHWPGIWNFVPHCRRFAQGFKIGFKAQRFQPAHCSEKPVCSPIRVTLKTE